MSSISTREFPGDSLKTHEWNFKTWQHNLYSTRQQNLLLSILAQFLWGGDGGETNPVIVHKLCPNDTIFITNLYTNLS